MRLKEIKIHQFGKLKDQTISLTDGINVIYGENESGKSTLHGFIRSMFFGVARYRGKASKTDPYSRFEPWERPMDFGGSLRFEAGGKTFLLERNFYKNDIRGRLVCEDDGEQLSLEQGDLEMLLGGISESVYDNTVSVGQLRSRTDEGMVRELQNYMTNYENSGSGDLDVQEAMERLKKKKKDWEKKEQEARKNQETAQDRLEQQIAYVEEEVHGLEARRQQLEQETAACREQEKSMQRLLARTEHREEEETESDEDLADDWEEEEIRPAFPVVGTGVALGLLLAGIWLGVKSAIAAGILCALAGILILGLSFYRYEKRRQQAWEEEEQRVFREEARLRRQNRQQTEFHARERELRQLQEKIHRLEGRREALEQQIEEKQTVRGNLLENQEEQMESSEETAICRQEIRSLELAMATLQKLSGTMQQKIGYRLQQKMGEILREITDGRYDQVAVDGDLKIQLITLGRAVPLYQLSRGTVEQVYLALRMAASQILCEEPMPVILDEVFAMYDEKRLIQVLHWLNRLDVQVLLFTCQKREAELLQKEKIAAHYVQLGV